MATPASISANYYDAYLWLAYCRHHPGEYSEAMANSGYETDEIPTDEILTILLANSLRNTIKAARRELGLPALNESSVAQRKYLYQELGQIVVESAALSLDLITSDPKLMRVPYPFANPNIADGLWSSHRKPLDINDMLGEYAV